MRFLLLVPVLLLCAVVRADVAGVRREVGHIDSMKLTHESRGGDGLSTPSTGISIFRDSSGSPRKIEIRTSSSSGQKRKSIYLQSNLPLFVSVKQDKWSIDAMDKLKVTTLNETRFYFDKGHLIEKRVGKKSLPLSKAQKISIEADTKKLIRSSLSRYQFI